MNENKYTNDIVAYATYGIDDNIDPNETVEVKLKDLMYVSATIAELVQFFHQPLHYQEIDDVSVYMGNSSNNGALNLLWNTQYEVVRKMLPESVDKLFDDGLFCSPQLPHYFKPKSED